MSTRDGGEPTLSWAAALILGFASSAFADEILPFYSWTFVGGVALTYFYASSHGLRGGLPVAMTVLTCMALQAAGAGGERLQVVAFQLPFLFLFFVAYAGLPSVLPTILEDEELRLTREADELQKKLAELEKTLLSERKERVQDKGSAAREETVKVSSRTSQLQTFLREVLQAASPKEIFGLLFANVTKVYGNLEVGLFTLLPNDEGYLLTKAGHPEYARLENKRLPKDQAPLLRQVQEKKSPVILPERVVLIEPDFAARFMVPLVVEGATEAILTLGKIRGEKELDQEDAQFLTSLAEIAQEAVCQLKVVLST